MAYYVNQFKPFRGSSADVNVAIENQIRNYKAGQIFHFESVEVEQEITTKMKTSKKSFFVWTRNYMQGMSPEARKMRSNAIGGRLRGRKPSKVTSSVQFICKLNKDGGYTVLAKI